LNNTFRFCALLLVILLSAACRARGLTPEDIPTRVPSIDALATAQIMTQNAPPEGYRETISFPQIDAGLTMLPNWRYEVLLEFEGVFARTPRQVSASTSAEVYFNQLGTQRRVVIQGHGELFGQQEEGVTLEGVRLGSDTFLVRDNVCLGDAGGAAATAADLRAGELIGGIIQGVPDGARAVINGEEVWRYAFGAQELSLPQIQTGDDGHVTLLSGELWVAPSREAVIRYYANLDVENAILLDSTLPVTGQVIIRYDLYDIGIDPNITQPFGC
jgi:hypothetical protein